MAAATAPTMVSNPIRSVTVIAPASSRPWSTARPSMSTHSRRLRGASHTGPSPSRNCSLVAGVAVVMVTVPGREVGGVLAAYGSFGMMIHMAT